MSTGGRLHWSEVGEATSVTGIRILCSVHRWLGRLPFLSCLYPVVFFHWLTRAGARRASLDYLRRVHAHWPGVFANRPGYWLSLRHLATFGDTLLTKIIACGGGYPVDRVEFRREVMLSQLRAREGGVIVTAHMGCLELTQALVREVPGLKVTVLVHTAHAERFNRLLARLDTGDTLRLQQVTELGPATAVMLGERVARGEFIAIAGDRVPLRGGRSVTARFLGAEARFPIGPYVLASALGCPLFAMSCLRSGRGYAIAFERLADRVRLPRGARGEALAGYAAAYAGWLESRVRQSPLDWFNFYDFWDDADADDGRNG